ncbi:MAG TPA: fatty acid desaturase [Anaeromyxobacteraceae bacterium]|nr:fatty acid desaturase [Anaeromyxobacteraceae bacterium]
MPTAVAAPRVTFLPPGPFHAEVRSRVDDYFFTTGRSPRGGWRLAVKGSVLLAWFVASWVGLVLCHPPWWLAVPLAVSLGLAWAGLGFDVMHDANHGASTKRHGLNRLLAFSSDLIGGSSVIWRQKHNVLHHGYTTCSASTRTSSRAGCSAWPLPSRAAASTGCSIATSGCSTRSSRSAGSSSTTSATS